MLNSKLLLSSLEGFDLGVDGAWRWVSLDGVFWAVVEVFLRGVGVKRLYNSVCTKLKNPWRSWHIKSATTYFDIFIELIIVCFEELRYMYNRNRW